MFRIFTIVAVLVSSSFCLHAQSISGTVANPNGNPLPGIRLLLLDEQGEVSARATTDNEGRYGFGKLIPQTYLIFVRESGFAQQRIQVRVEPAADSLQDFRLELETLTEHVVVTATRTETSTSLVGNSVTVLSEKAIDARKALQVPDLLRVTPATNVLQVGGRGSLTTIFVRGGESDYNKVLLDGVPLNQPGGAVDLSNLSAANVERIEIVRGPQSALYGSDAISSVIQIFTRRGIREQARPEVDLFVEGGTYETFRAGAALRGGTRRLTYNLGFEHYSTDNMEPNDYFHNNSFSSRLGIETSRNSTLEIFGHVTRGRSGVPGATAFGPPDLEEFYRKRDLLAGLRWSQRLSDAWSHKLTYSHSYVNQLSADPIASPPFVPTFRGKAGAFTVFDFPFSFLSATRRHVVNYQSDVLISTHLISTGFDLEEQRGVVGEVRADRTNFGYYAQDQFLVKQRLALTAGLRLEKNETFGFAAVPRVSVACLLRNGEGFWGMTRPKFHFGLGIKEPNFIESFSPNFFFKGNPDLKPERTRSFEAGIEQKLAANRIRVEINYFHNLFEDLIAFQTVNPTTFEGSFFNLAESRAWGLEHIVEAAPAKWLKLSGGYTYLNSKVLRSASPSDPVFREGARLLLRPTHSGFAGLTWTSSKWQVNSGATFMGDRSDSDFRGLGLTSVDAYTRWDLSASYRVNPNVEVYAAFDNVLNRAYFEEIGFPALKFNFRSGLRLRF